MNYRNGVLTGSRLSKGLMMAVMAWSPSTESQTPEIGTGTDRWVRGIHVQQTRQYSETAPSDRLPGTLFCLNNSILVPVAAFTIQDIPSGNFFPQYPARMMDSGSTGLTDQEVSLDPITHPDIHDADLLHKATCRA